jgi:hypothetical protein
MKLFRFFLILEIFLSNLCYALGDDMEDMHFDSGRPNKNDKHFYVIKTNSPSLLNIDFRISNRANDINCKKGHIYSSFEIIKGKKIKRDFNFSRKASPNIALYEWNMCFIIKGVTYKAWRGFDPGPNTTLNVDCFINQDQIKSKNTNLYLCKAQTIKHNQNNYTEYAVLCSGNDKCRYFDTKKELDLWNAVSKDPSLLENVAYSVLKYELSKGNDLDGEILFVNIAGKDPSKRFLSYFNTSSKLVIKKGSEWKQGKGVSYSIHNIIPINEKKLEVTISTYCGDLCASNIIITLEYIKGEWQVVSSQLNWIS